MLDNFNKFCNLNNLLFEFFEIRGFFEIPRAGPFFKIDKKSKKQKGKKGGYSRVRWGCYSGGKKKSRHRKTNSSG